MNAAFLAFAYLRFHWARSLVLVLVLALILVVPLATRILLAESEAALTARAEATPLLLGRRGSALDLTMAALYFSDARPDALPMAEVEAVWDSGLATPIPLNTAFETSGFRIVGTSLDYFDFRKLTVAQGRGLAVLGEAVVGATVARDLDLAVGDTLVSSPQNLFDLDGVYPLEMPVVGILAPTNTPDDDAVFVDIKTTWVIAGIGHGHEDVVTAADLAAGGDVTAAAGIVQYQRITPDNIDSFHFHGDTGRLPGHGRDRGAAGRAVGDDPSGALSGPGRDIAARPARADRPGPCRPHLPDPRRARRRDGHHRACRAGRAWPRGLPVLPPAGARNRNRGQARRAARHGPSALGSGNRHGIVFGVAYCHFGGARRAAQRGCLGRLAADPWKLNETESNRE
jgi:hypothetical protein